jgi:deazaflavin-dependent oxidoreductase (nitroreductase family)
MPLPRPVARINQRLTNRILGPLARYVPGFGVVVHTGRRTHRQYRTPVNVFRRPRGFVIALTYGTGAEWVRNVLANGGCELDYRGRRVRLIQPRLVHDPKRGLVPAPVRLVLGLLKVCDFLELTLDEGQL